MRCAALLITLFTANTGCSQCLGLNEASLGEPARLIAPLSMSTVTQQRPLLRWELSKVQRETTVDLCKDRSCATPLPVTAVVSGDHFSAVPSAPLPPGWVFWRLRTGSGSRTVISATWQFWVGRSSASNPVDTSNGAILDVNGDGYPDLLIGADTAGAGAGTAHLYLGSATASVTEWNAASTATRIDLISPHSANTSFGYSVSSAGDVNGDGYADFLVGAPGAGAKSGTAHLYLGSAKPSADDWNGASARSRIDLDDLAGAGSVFGVSVANAGDVNGDGFADFLVGASKAGMVHLYLGSATPDAEGWNGATSVRRIDLAGPEVSLGFGNSVASAGDVNGDGYADFLVGADGTNAAAGAAYVYLGSATPSASAWNAAVPERRIDLTYIDDPRASFGSSVTSAGDVNGDGYADFLIGARTAGSVSGSARLYLGSAMSAAADWNGASPAHRIELTDPDGASAVFGSSVAGAGDVNGDGYADFLVGAEGVDAGSGAAHLYLGAIMPDAAAWNGASAASRITLSNPAGAGARFGASVASAGDVNGDGYSDFLVGAHGAGALGGASQLYLGSAMPGENSWDGASPSGRMDLANPAGASAGFGVSVASTRNVDSHDGLRVPGLLVGGG
jgi:hypothetical protein